MRIHKKYFFLINFTNTMDTNYKIISLVDKYNIQNENTIGKLSPFFKFNKYRFCRINSFLFKNILFVNKVFIIKSTINLLML